LLGHPWIFSGAIGTVEGNPSPGEIILVEDWSHRPLGLGFYSKSNITIRMITQDPYAIINKAFWRERIFRAIALRKKVVPLGTDAYRLINAEGDGIPGLIVDVYNRYLVISINTAGVEKLKSLFLEILEEFFSPLGIYEQSEGRARKLEGLPDKKGTVFGSIPPLIEIKENNYRFAVDLIGGQKTGFFLDQGRNREIIGALCRNLTVLNCFCYTAAFSVYAIAGGAKRVISIDSSARACEIARKNLILNNMNPNCHPIYNTDVFEFLDNTQESPDLIILDPPAFAKTLKEVKAALAGYENLNQKAAKRLNEGGMLATFSCSNPVNIELFQRAVSRAIAKTGKTAQLLSLLGPAFDHPTILNHWEGRYLKGLLLILYNSK